MIKGGKLGIGPRRSKSAFDMFKPIAADNAKDMAVQTGLDFIVTKQPLKYSSVLRKEEFTCEKCDHAHKVPLERVSPSHVSIVRMDNDEQVGVMKKNYGLVQYIDMLEFTELLVKEGEAGYVSGGYTGEGERAWVVMKTADYVDLSEEDRVSCYFYITTSHDGTSALNVIPAALREHSKTVLIAPGALNNNIKIKHTKHVIDRVARARNSLTKVKTYWEEFGNSFQLMGKVVATPSVVKTYLEMLAPDAKTDKGQTKIEELRGKIETVYRTSPSCKLPSTNGTLLGLYFAATEFYDHHTITRKRKTLDANSARVESMLAGNVAEKKARSYAAAIKIEEKLGGFNLTE